MCRYENRCQLARMQAKIKRVDMRTGASLPECRLIKPCGGMGTGASMPECKLNKPCGGMGTEASMS